MMKSDLILLQNMDIKYPRLRYGDPCFQSWQTHNPGKIQYLEKLDSLLYQKIEFLIMLAYHKCANSDAFMSSRHAKIVTRLSFNLFCALLQ